MCGKRTLWHWSMGGKRNNGTHPWAGKGCYHGCTETVWRWLLRRSSIGQATKLTSRWRGTGRCRCRYRYICTAMHSLKVPQHEIFLFQNMLPIDVFIKVAFFVFFKFGRKIWLKSKFPKNIGLWNWGKDFIVALITFSINFLVALNTIARVYRLL